jgi:threo-3-hydroxy-L-aspartate ammonia-lyase
MVTLEEIKAAQRRLRGHANITPVKTSRTLNSLAGCEVFLKCENFQRGGAFKFRGAFNAMVQLSAAQKQCGVVTFSSGNHAQAVAMAGGILGIRTTVVMPHNAPLTKREATEGYGARVILCDAAERVAVASKLQKESGAVMVAPFDDYSVMAGQGTATLELLEEVGALDFVLAPCGGGGLLSGTAIAAKGLYPDCRVVGIEPEVADDATRSFRTKTLQRVENPPTIADGVRTPALGELTFPLILKNVTDMATVSEKSIREALHFLLFRMKLVVEPSGVLGIAALLSGSLKARGRVGVIISGGNISAEVMREVAG